MRFPRLPVLDENGPCWECQEADVEDCAYPCEHGHCEHLTHCDACGRGMDYRSDNGCCFVCDAEWLAGHMLQDRRRVIGVDFGSPGGDVTITHPKPFAQSYADSEPKPCLLCGQLTTGSVGAAGIRWAQICPRCKTSEDNALRAVVKAQAQALNFVHEKLFGGI